MKEDNKYIEKLIDRFFNGTTSNEEEQELYAFLKQKDIPENLKQYKDVFCFFETEIHTCLSSKNVLDVQTRNGKSYTKRILIATLSIAACIALVIYLFPINNAEYDIYEGSYIVRNGEKITDLKAILPELQMIAYNAEQIVKEREEKIYPFAKKNDKYKSTEEKISLIYNDIVNRFPEGAVREEVYKTLK